MADETKKIYVSASYSEGNVPEGAVWGETAFATIDEALAAHVTLGTAAEIIIADEEVTTTAQFTTGTQNLKITSSNANGTTWNIAAADTVSDFRSAETYIDENIKIVGTVTGVQLTTYRNKTAGDQEVQKLIIAGDIDNVSALRAYGDTNKGGLGDTIVIEKTSNIFISGGDGVLDAAYGGTTVINGELESTKGNLDNMTAQVRAGYTQIRGASKIELNNVYVSGGTGEGWLTFNSDSGNLLALNNSIYAVATITAGSGTGIIDLQNGSRFIFTGSTTVKTVEAIKIDTNSTLEYSTTLDFVNPAAGKLIQITADYSQAESAILVWVNGTGNASAASIADFVSVNTAEGWTVVTDQQGSAYAYNEARLNESYVVNTAWQGITTPSLYSQDGVSAIISKNGIDSLDTALANVAEGGSIHVIDGKGTVTLSKDVTMSGHVTGGQFNIGNKSENGPAATLTIAEGTSLQVDSHMYLGFGTPLTGENGRSTNGNVLVQGNFNIRGMNQRPDGILTIEKGGTATIRSGEDVNILGGTTNVTGDGTFETVSLNLYNVQMFNDRPNSNATVNAKDALLTVDGGVLLGRNAGHQGVTNVDKGSNQINLDNSILEIQGKDGSNSNSINLGSAADQLPEGYKGFGDSGKVMYAGGGYTDTSVTLTNGSILDSKHYVIIGADVANVNAVMENTITIDSLSMVTFDKGMYVYNDASVTGGTKASITINADFDLIESTGANMIFWVDGMGSSEGLKFLNMDGSDASAAADSLVKVNKTGANAANWEIVTDKNGIYAYDSSKVARFDTMLSLSSACAVRCGTGVSDAGYATNGMAFEEGMVVLLTDADYTGNTRLTDTGTYRLAKASAGWSVENFNLSEELIARGYEIKEAGGTIWMAQKELSPDYNLEVVLDSALVGMELEVGDIVVGTDGQERVFGKEIFASYNEAVYYLANHYLPGMQTTIVGYGEFTDFSDNKGNAISPYWGDNFTLKAGDADKGFTIVTKYFDLYNYAGSNTTAVINEGVTIDLSTGGGRAFRNNGDLDVYGTIINCPVGGDNRFELVGTWSTLNVYATGQVFNPTTWAASNGAYNIYGNGTEYTHAQYTNVSTSAQAITSFSNQNGKFLIADYGWVETGHSYIGQSEGTGSLTLKNHGKLNASGTVNIFAKASLNLDSTSIVIAKNFNLKGAVNVTIDSATIADKAVLLQTTGDGALDISSLTVYAGEEVLGLGGAFDIDGAKYMLNVGAADADGVKNDLMVMKAPVEIVVDSTGSIDDISQGQVKEIDTAFAALGVGTAVTKLTINDAEVFSDLTGGYKDLYGDFDIVSGNAAGSTIYFEVADGKYTPVYFNGKTTIDSNISFAAKDEKNSYSFIAYGEDAVLTIKGDTVGDRLCGIGASGGTVIIEEESSLYVSGGDGALTANYGGSVIINGAGRETQQHRFGYINCYSSITMNNTNVTGGMTLQIAGGEFVLNNTTFGIWTVGAWGGSGDGTIRVTNGSLFEVGTTGGGKNYTAKFTAGAEIVVDWTSQFVYGGKNSMILEAGATIIADFTGFNVTETLQNDQFALLVKDALGHGITGAGEVEYKNLKELEAAGWTVGDKNGQVYIYDKTLADGKDVALYEAGADFGAVVTVLDKDYRYGINAFDKLEAAVDATAAGGVVNIAEYTFNGYDATVSMNVVDMTLGDGTANAAANDVLNINEGKVIYTDKLNITESTDITGKGVIKLDRTDAVSIADGAVVKVTAAQILEFAKLDDISGILGSFQVTESCEQDDMDMLKEIFGADKVDFAEGVKATVTEKLPEGGLGGVTEDTTVVTGSTGNDKMTVGKGEAIDLHYDINMGGGTNTFDVGANGSIEGNGNILNVNKLNIANGAKDADKVQQDTVIDLGTGKVETSGAKATVTIGNFTQVTALGGIGKNEMGGSNAITIGTNSEVELGDISNLASLTLKNNTGTAVDSTVSNDTVFSAGDIEGLNSNGSLNFGSNNSVEVGDINMGGGTNSLAIGSNTDFGSGSISGITNLTIGNGTAIKTFVDGDKEQQWTEVYVGGDINAPAANNKLAIGNFANVEIAGDIKNTADTGTTVTLGSDSSLDVGTITGLAGLTIGNGKTEVSTATIGGGITGTYGNNNIKVGDKAKLEIGASLNLMGGVNSLTIGKTSVVTVGNNVKNIQKVTMNGAEFIVAGNYTAGEGKNTLALNAGTTQIMGNLAASDLGSVIGITIGKADAKLIVDGDMEAINTIKTNAGSIMEVGGDIEGTEGKDTYTFGADNAFFASSIDMGMGKDTLTIGASNSFIVDEDVVGANAVTINGGAAKRNENKEMIQYVTEVEIGGDFAMEGTANTFNVKNFANVNIGEDFISEGAANVTVGANSEMTVGGDMTGINKLTVAAGSGKEYNTEMGDVAVGITKLTVDGDMTGTEKADTITTNKNSELVISGDLDLGDDAKDALKLGADSWTMIGGEISGLDTFAAGKGAVVLATAESIALLEGLNSKLSGVTFVDIDDVIEGTTVNNSTKGGLVMGFGTEDMTDTFTLGDSENGWTLTGDAADIRVFVNEEIVDFTGALALNAGDTVSVELFGDDSKKAASYTIDKVLA